MKAIVTDLDRTLLRADKTLSAYSADVLNRCRACGLRVIASSARPLRDIVPFEEQIAFDAVIASNGAVVRLPGRLLHSRRFGIGTTKESTKIHLLHRTSSRIRHSRMKKSVSGNRRMLRVHHRILAAEKAAAIRGLLRARRGDGRVVTEESSAHRGLLNILCGRGGFVSKETTAHHRLLRGRGLR